jgi:hypothetical protein
MAEDFFQLTLFKEKVIVGQSQLFLVKKPAIVNEDMTFVEYVNFVTQRVVGTMFHPVGRNEKIDSTIFICRSFYFFIRRKQKLFR